ncbi:hypothetical protein AAG906_011792 [Vitis piasezkii]
MDALARLVIIFSSVLFIVPISIAVDTITVNQPIRYGETIISAGGSFELGFYTPENSKNQYLGIWYKKVTPRTVVWVANGDFPLTDSLGVLKVTDQGTLVILNGTNSIIWSSNASRSAQNPTAQLLESGNLVLKNGNDDDPENFLWQSFDYPCSTLLPSMKLGRNKSTGQEWYLSSSKSTDDPSKGNLTYRLDPHGYPQLLKRNGLILTFCSGPWNGLRFSGFRALAGKSIYKHVFTFNEKEMYYTYELLDSSVVSRLVLNSNGDVQRLTWTDVTGWTEYSTMPMDDCDGYAFCGVHGFCNINQVPKCGCLDGFQPNFPNNWEMGVWSNGCFRSRPLDCQRGEWFKKYSGVKLPDTRNSTYIESINLNKCKSECLRNCSCTAYATPDIKGGKGCLLWFGDLFDIRDMPDDRQEFFVRMAASELETNSSSTGKKRRWVIVCSVSIMGVILLGLSLTWYVLKKKKQKRNGELVHNSEENTNEEEKKDLELPLFDLATILNATNNFSIENKLGEGGFGPVYKGLLQQGQEVAVKRLSKDSRQGLIEFKTEVIHIANLQHRNLVKLLGCCIHGQEKMLIYEYMSNKSLESFIFDKRRSKELDWPKRFLIINGIARGLLYLHQDSRLRIIHRDLKADNILLDSEMGPKISDFGIARSFGGNETEANTTKVVGTLGYISPEYASEGLYSVKSDVFSFGVMVLEIVSGKRNRGFSHPDHRLNLLGHAWTLYTEGRYLELMDAMVGDTFQPSEVLRSIHVGLLCVQHCADDRPSMSSVVLMLSSEVALPQPREPGFFCDWNSSRNCRSYSGTEAITLLSSPDDQPSVSSVVLMLSSEGALSLPKEPGFSLSRKQILPQASWGHFQVLLDTPWKTFHVDVLLSKDQSTGNSIKPFISDQVIRSYSMLDGLPIKRILPTYADSFFLLSGEFEKPILGDMVQEVGYWDCGVTVQGTLVILNGTNTIIWSSDASQSAQNPTAQLLESGNLVMKNGNDNLDRYLSSWKTTDDPSMGNFTYELDPSGFLQLIRRNGSAVTFPSGSWNGLRFSGFPALRPNPIYKYAFIFNDKEIFYTYELINSSVVSRLVLKWLCATYSSCGVHGTCDINDIPKCQCMKGFVPKYPNDWAMADWSSGCVRRTPLNCQHGDGFLKYSGIKLPDTQNSWFNVSMDLKECAAACLKNCSCTAYANLFRYQ